MKFFLVVFFGSAFANHPLSHGFLPEDPSQPSLVTNFKLLLLIKQEQPSLLYKFRVPLSTYRRMRLLQKSRQCSHIPICDCSSFHPNVSFFHFSVALFLSLYPVTIV